jgi:hypothetical protein
LIFIYFQEDYEDLSGNTKEIEVEQFNDWPSEELKD